MSWESSAEYYRLANQAVRHRLGGLHSARLMLTSLDFAEIESLQAAGQWDQAGQILAQEGRVTAAEPFRVLERLGGTGRAAAVSPRPRLVLAVPITTAIATTTLKPGART